MPVGLSKNSPIQLTLSKENYEALISRHGQWIRWRIGNKCPCVENHSQQPNPQCNKCGGVGYQYSFQKNKQITETIGITNDKRIIEVSEKNATLAYVYNHFGKRIEAEKTDQYITLNENVQKGTFLTVVMNIENIKILAMGTANHIGAGFYSIDALQISKPKTEGLTHSAPCDIVAIEKITDSNGNIYEFDELRLNIFHTDSEVEILKITNVQYIEPNVFVLLNQDLSKEDNMAMVESQGDAIITFPYNTNVSMQDVLTVLSGTYTKKQVVKRFSIGDDTISAFFVEKITNCIGLKRDYVSGVDFVLFGTNKIKWLCNDCPSSGEAYSITYEVFPTYKVVKTIPQIRTSENQRLPKKAIVQLYDSCGEYEKVNRQW